MAVQTYVKPQGDELDLLVRVPLEAMRDVAFPLRGPGYIDLAAADETLRDAATIWIANAVEIYENGEQIGDYEIDAVRLSLPSNRAFQNYEAALDHVTGPPLPAATELYANQALLDVLIRYPISAADAAFSIYPDFRRLGLNTTTIVRFLPPGGAERLFEFSDDPGLVHLDPRWHHAFGRFIVFGFDHILDGIDHLMFVMCLIIPFRRIRPLVAIVTSFTVAHSLTLIGSAFGITPSALWFPSLIESLIAASIVYMALENIIGSRWERRWLVAFGFGLVHGFGFSFALSETLQFAGGHLLTSLLAFNLGVELGQLLIIVIAVPLLNLLFRAGIPERTGTIILSAILAHSGWHWMSDRVAELTAYRFGLPDFNAALLAAAMRWLMLALITGLVLWVMYTLYRRLMSRQKPTS
ncbi:MAG: HupE/UreJ family protein [Woeseiaceae bacterium]|nr:HupE/UreJ family protein [Woeseiaceae bacterium]